MAKMMVRHRKTRGLRQHSDAPEMTYNGGVLM